MAWVDTHNVINCAQLVYEAQGQDHPLLRFVRDCSGRTWPPVQLGPGSAMHGSARLPAPACTRARLGPVARRPPRLLMVLAVLGWPQVSLTCQRYGAWCPQARHLSQRSAFSLH